jgi:MFS family permease
MKSLFAPRDASANPAPAEVYNWRIYFLACSAAMGSAMFGYDSAFIGGSLSLPAFKSRFGLVGKSAKQSAALSANIVSTFQAGCFFGAILVYYFTERFGRKFVLMACGAIFNVGAIVQLSSHGTLGTLYAGRALTGK